MAGVDLNPAPLWAKRVPLRTVHVGEEATNSRSNHTDLSVDRHILTKREDRKMEIKENKARFCELTRTEAPDVEQPGQVTSSWTK